MTEREPSELDLAEAFRAYAEEASTQVRPSQLARHFATVYPHGRTGFGPWGLGTTVRLAWVPVLLAGLLITVAGGILIVRSQPEQNLAAGVPPFECPAGSTPDEPGPIDQARPVGSKTAAFDRRAGRLVAEVIGVTDLVETWTFDICTNTWSRMHPDREPPDFAWRPLVYDVDSDLTIGVAHGPDGGPPGRVWAYDLAADTWTEKVTSTDKTLRAYEPLSGLVVATKDLLDGAGQPELWTYDVETDTWTLIDRVTGPASHAVLAYDASVDRIVAYSPPETWLFDSRTGTWSRAEGETPVVEPNWAVPTITYDESAERTVVTGSAGMAAYDAAANRWEVLAGPGESHANPYLYDSVNGRLVGFGWEGDVVAFDLKTRTWTVLLAPSDGQSAPSPE